MSDTMTEADALLVACPADGALNRVARARLAAHPRCGKCGNALFQGRTITLGGANFERHALKSDLPLVVDFWASWCGPGRAMGPAFEGAAARLEPRVRMAKLDTEAEPALAARYRVESIPTMIMLRKGRELARTSGAMPTEAIVRWVEEALRRADRRENGGRGKD
jgi:thioredoxin 2